MRGLVFYGTTGKFTFRMLATVLAGQSVCLFLGALVARAVTASEGDDGSGTAYLVVGCGLAVLCVLAAGSMRRPWGVSFGWVIQALTLLSALVVPMMFFVWLIFLALWVGCLMQGYKVDRLDARRAAAAAAAADADGLGAADDGPGQAAEADGTSRPIG
ncbi:MAG: DUF4233 domain-containing protein [Humibacillus sp.]|nr:DUF4233 domain-containing protein [Humibacillus sp.]MDN5777614.1 DUF4233 domain-containing protein [Humibacillus sp.]